MSVIFRKMAAATVLLILLGSYGYGAAQEKGQPAKTEQQTGQKKQVRTILDFKTELNLTEDQAKKIRDYLSALDKEFRVKKANLSLADVDLQNLMEKDADIAEIKRKIRESFEMQASMRIAEIETARNINKILSSEQLKRWKEIRASGGKK